jgi:hypothetical protein
MSGLQPSFLCDPVTWSRDELVAQYRTLAARYRRMATVEDRPLARDGLLELARQCDAGRRRYMLGSPTGFGAGNGSG